MGEHIPEHVFTNFAVGEWDRVLRDGHYYQVTHIPGGYRLLEEDGPRKHEVNKSKMSQDIALGLVEVQPDYYTLAKKNDRELMFALDSADMPLDIRVRIQACAAFLQGVKEKKWARSKPKVEAFLKEFAAEQAAILHKHAPKQARGGTIVEVVSDRHPVQWRQFVRIVNLYESHANSANALMKRYKGSARGTKMPKETQAFLRGVFLRHAKPSPTAALQLLETENFKRKEKGIDQIPVPEIRTTQRFMKAISDIEKLGARMDAKKARLDLALSYGGPGAEAPLERVEMDEKFLDVFVFLTETGLINEIHPDIIARLERMASEVDDDEDEEVEEGKSGKRKRKKKAKKSEDNRKRLWWSVAMDVASRSVLGMKILRTVQPTPRDAVEVLEMACTSKAHIVEALRTKNPWPQEGKPWFVVADHGGAYDSFEFQHCVVALTGNVLSPPADHPYMRGTIERFFRTIDGKYMHLLPGQSFGNIIAKGAGYNPKKAARLTDIELAECLSRLIIDSYHNTPQDEALGGRTPLQMWGFLNKTHEVRQVDEETRRKAFAISVPNRHITDSGLVFLGLPYGDERVQEIRNQSTKGTFTIRVSPRDLSKIWVKTQNGRGYYELQCNLSGTEHLTLNQWKAALHHMRKTVKKSQEGSWEIALRAIYQVQKLVKAAEDRAGIAIATWTVEDLQNLERDVVQGVIYKRPYEMDYGQQIHQQLNPGDGSANAPIEDLAEPQADLDSEFGDVDDGIKRDPNRFATPEEGVRREGRPKPDPYRDEPPQAEPNSSSSGRRSKSRIGGPKPWQGIKG
ncbi:MULTISPECIES: hypothetical protein [unclassified Rhizobium]|uniref:hypothetical protein n=1 Tax=unclassified Rhizobium TaxID=2613769 RepID=UPI001ADC5B8B|nr:MULTISPECIES: hypothetical protein [unclassified Rhizobium]MBO9127805.1 hypothetical protein [Rhizobium sp. 16-488-2b]MBO9178267.1 hypothetical protein [Rhizobium sp. 16-488-2a]